jgi:hypothetical protein
MSITINPDPLVNPGITVSPLLIRNALNWRPRIAAHVEPWFNTASASHLNIGYSSNNPTVVQQQATFLHSRGVDFVIFDWNGKDDAFQTSTCLVWKKVCESIGLNFAFCFDHSLFKAKPSSNPANHTLYMKEQFAYILATFAPSKNYERTASGKLLAIEFGWELEPTLDAGAVLSAYPQFAMLWEGNNGYTRPGSAGAFAWVGFNPADPSGCVESYQTSFLRDAGLHAKQISMAALVKGFDDHARRPGQDISKSVWNYPNDPARIAPEKQGQTFLNTINILNASAHKPPYVQITTFNDHEEGSFFEWGINSQLTVTHAFATKNNLNFALHGNLNTVSSVKILVDGVLRATVSTIPVNGVVTAYLATYKLAYKTHVVTAIVVGKDFFQQKESAPVSYHP